VCHQLYQFRLLLADAALQRRLARSSTIELGVGETLHFRRLDSFVDSPHLLGQVVDHHWQSDGVALELIVLPLLRRLLPTPHQPVEAFYLIVFGLADALCEERRTSACSVMSIYSRCPLSMKPRSGLRRKNLGRVSLN
jgi:hypothetical protein